MAPRLTVVILTLNEEHSIAACLASLARQTEQDFEVVVIDANSKDATVQVATEAGAAMPGRVRIRACPFRMPIGQARNLGAELAHAPAVAYVSADVELASDWVARALVGLQRADMVFGRQKHAPHTMTVPAAVRGMRYAFPTSSIEDALPFASNVAGVYRTEILRRFPFDDDADAAEDLVTAKEAVEAGYRIHYDPDMCATHRDITRHKEELNKNVREGRGWAAYRNQLGIHKEWLAWGGVLAALGAATVVRRLRAPGIAGAIAVLWAPALRRAMRGHSMRPATAAKAVAVAPFYDLAFLANYIRGLTRPARRRP